MEDDERDVEKHKSKQSFLSENPSLVEWMRLRRVHLMNFRIIFLHILIVSKMDESNIESIAGFGYSHLKVLVFRSEGRIKDKDHVQGCFTYGNFWSI